LAGKVPVQGDPAICGAFAEYLKGLLDQQDLKAADPATQTVAVIADHWGFWNTGNIAADCQRLFGELPSQTMRGCKPKVHEPG
jgi:hypothetical protein